MEQEVTDCHRILRTSEKKMTRSGREGESRVSLDDTAAADSRARERAALGVVTYGMGWGIGRGSTVFLRTAWAELHQSDRSSIMDL